MAFCDDDTMEEWMYTHDWDAEEFEFRDERDALVLSSNANCLSSINLLGNRNATYVGRRGYPTDYDSFMAKLLSHLPKFDDVVSDHLSKCLREVRDLTGFKHEYTKDCMQTETTGVNVDIANSKHLNDKMRIADVRSISDFQKEMKRCVRSIRDQLDKENDGAYKVCMNKAARIVDGVNCYEKHKVIFEGELLKGMGLLVATDLINLSNRVFIKNKIPICFIGNICGRRMVSKMIEAVQMYSKLCKITNTNIVQVCNMSNEEKIYSINESSILSMISCQLLSNGIYCFGIGEMVKKHGSQIKEKFTHFIQSSPTNNEHCKRLFDMNFFAKHESTAERYMDI